MRRLWLRIKQSTRSNTKHLHRHAFMNATDSTLLPADCAANKTSSSATPTCPITYPLNRFSCTQLLEARLHRIETNARVPASAWDWSYLEFLDGRTFDLWTLVVYAAILLQRSRVFAASSIDADEDLPRRCTNVALTMATKMVHDGPLLVRTSLDDEVWFCKRLLWKLFVHPDEFIAGALTWTIL